MTGTTGVKRECEEAKQECFEIALSQASVEDGYVQCVLARLGRLASLS